MQIVLPFQNNRWQDVQKIALNWTAAEPKNAEAWYYLGAAAQQLDNQSSAHQYFQKALSLLNNHPSSLQALALMAQAQGNNAEVDKIRLALKQVSQEALESLELALRPAQ